MTQPKRFGILLDMKNRNNAFIVAINTPNGTVSYWTGTKFTADKSEAQIFRTLQAVDRSAVRIRRDSGIADSTLMYVTE